MKKLVLSLAAAMAVTSAFAFPKALYVKQGESFTKYNFGVASDLHFTDNGRTLNITGYGQKINLDNIDYITFSAPVDNTGLTPAEQKEKMVEIGEEIYSKIDLDRHSDILNMWHVFFDSFRLPDGSRHRGCTSYYIDPSYYEVHKSASAVVNAVASLVKGNPAAARTLKAKAVDLYRASDYFGVYTADHAKREWVKTSEADYFEIRFDDVTATGTFSVKIEPSDDFTFWQTSDFDLEMPRKLLITFSKDTRTVATATVTTEIVQDQSIDMQLDFMSNGYAVLNTMNVVNTGISDKTEVTIDGSHFFSCDTYIAGANLMNYDEMHSAIKEATHYHDENDNCCGEDPTELFAHVFRATTNIDFIGRLQAEAKLFGANTVYNSLNEESDTEELIIGDDHLYTNGLILSSKDDNYHISYTDSSVLEKSLTTLNSYSDAVFYYDGEKKPQGYFVWDISEEEQEYYMWMNPENTMFINLNDHLVMVSREILDSTYDPESETGWKYTYGDWYYTVYSTDSYESKKVYVDEKDLFMPESITDHNFNLEPIMMFPDLTTFRVEDFFDNISFKDLIDDYNEIIDTYMNLTGQEKDRE